MQPNHGLAIAALLLCATAGAVTAADLARDAIAGYPNIHPSQRIPSALLAQGRVLIDRSHGEDFDVSGFTDLLTQQGWSVTIHTAAPITPSVLEQGDVFLIPPDVLAPFSPAEIDAIHTWVNSGGGLWALQEIAADPGLMNALANTFGVQFKADIVLDPTQNRGFPEWPTITDFSVHPIFDQVSAFGYYAGVCLTAVAPQLIAARSSPTAHSLECSTSPAVIAVANPGSGRAVFTGDATPLHPSYYPAELDASEQRLLQNIINYLLGSPGPVAAMRTSWAALKTIYR